MSVKRRKIACLLAVPLNASFFLPLINRLNKEGVELIFIVPLSNHANERHLIKNNISFRYTTDYMDQAVREKIKACKSASLDAWSLTCFEWEGFRRWPFFKQSWFFETAIEDYFCMEEFLKRERPDLFMAQHECNRWGQMIGHLTTRESIPFLTFQEGGYYDDYMGSMIHTQYSTADLLWGENARKLLKRYKCSDDKMFLIGSMNLENTIRQYKNEKMKAEIKEELKIPFGKRIILFLVDIHYGSVIDKSKWKSIFKGLDRIDPNAVVLFKWHSTIKKEGFEEIQRIFKKLYPRVRLFYDDDPYKLLAISDDCVTMGKTTLAIEALAFGKPLFMMPMLDSTEYYFVDLGIAQKACPSGNWSSLIRTLESGLPETMKAAVDHYINEMFYRLEGGSVDRAVDVIDYMLLTIEEAQNENKAEKPGPLFKQEERISGRVSFIVPSGRDPEALLSTLTSLSQNVKFEDWETVIVIQDEAISEILGALSGDVRTIRVEGDQLGKLYNKGGEIATGELLFFMPPGTLYMKGEGLLERVREGVVGLPIRNPDMSPQSLGIGFDFNGSPYPITEESRTPDVVGGGFVGMRAESFWAIGRFDEDMANHLIETDLCLKAIENNIPVNYHSDGLAVQYKKTFFGEDLSEEAWRNRVRFFTKWVGKLPKDEDILTFSKDFLLKV